tara:strand:- start:10 stop:747 length:738 start_codon:yes stop_codon:yes gene_type:complete
MFRKIKKYKKYFNLFINYMDDDTKKLFPEVNPNINEVIEREKALDQEEVIIDDKLEEEKTEQKDIFVTSKKSKPKKNVKLEVGEKKDKYAHLAAARQKGIETRRRKAAERKALKEAEKKKKEEERQARREATMERNRQKAKERYYKQKQSKEKIPEKIYKETKPPQNYEKMAQHAQQPAMDFNTFAKYMMKYENMKEAYNKQKSKKVVEKREPKKTKPIQQFNPPNYPLAHLYNPNMRNTNNYNF